MSGYSTHEAPEDAVTGFTVPERGNGREEPNVEECDAGQPCPNRDECHVEVPPLPAQGYAVHLNEPAEVGAQLLERPNFSISLNFSGLKELPMHDPQPLGPTDEKGYCSICCENILQKQVAQMMGCGHTFHYVCIKEWLKGNGSCPNCRRGVIVPLDSPEH